MNILPGDLQHQANSEMIPKWNDEEEKNYALYNNFGGKECLK